MKLNKNRIVLHSALFGCVSIIITQVVWYFFNKYFRIRINTNFVFFGFFISKLQILKLNEVNKLQIIAFKMSNYFLMIFDFKYND